MAKDRQMHLGVFFNPTGHHVASWRHEEAQADAGVNFQHYVELAQTAERGKFDMVFLADNLNVREANIEALSRSAQYIANFEPITLLSALAVATKRIGLAATASTSYNEPFHVARKFGSLDHISGGRAAWNVVTSSMSGESRNFGRDQHFGHAERYDRAREFIRVVMALWDSWEDDAFIRDKQSGRFFDPAKLHPTEHKGMYFSVHGPLNMARPPQGYPVIVQAGASDDGRSFAAEFAEIVFSSHFTLPSAQEYYVDVKKRAVAFGRDPNTVKILPGLGAVVGRTMAEAKEKHDKLQSFIHPIVAREVLSLVLGGTDLSKYDLDEPLPDDLPRPEGGGFSQFENWTKLAREENLSIRELAMRAAASRGKSAIVGTPESIADHMEEWFSKGAADGFNIQPLYLPGALNDFVDLVIPELQRRGLFRTEYTGRTLRDHFGLPRPANQFASSKRTEQDPPPA